MRNTIRKVTIELAILMISYQASLKWNSDTVAIHGKITPQTRESDEAPSMPC